MIVVGSGSKYHKLVKNTDKNIKFTGRISDSELAGLYENCIGFIFPPEEDAGITPLEAMAAGRPVIAYGKGGATESVVNGITGEFFYSQTAENLAQTIKNFKPEKYDPEAIRNHAAKFDIKIFENKITNFINNKIKNRSYYGI